MQRDGTVLLNDYFKRFALHGRKPLAKFFNVGDGCA